MIESGNVSPAVSVGHIEGLQVLEVLGGRGATSIGYRVTDGERMLFMKRLRPELLGDERMRMVFRKEYEVGCRVQSPHVVRYVDFHEETDNVYILMEYVAGKTLLGKITEEGGAPLTYPPQPDNLITSKPLTLPTIRTWFVQLLEGLGALHREGIVHLDIKPDNLLIADVNQHLVIADLGYCHQDSYLAPLGKTRGYAAPELSSRDPSTNSGQVLSIDIRADIYSAGRVLQEMLRSAQPDRDAQDGCGQPLEDTYLKEALLQISEKCCAENPSDRYASVDEVQNAVDSLSADDECKPKSTSRRWIAAIVLAALLVAIGGYGFWHYRHVGYHFGMEFRVTSTDSMTCEVTGPADRSILGRLLSPPPSGCESHSPWATWTFVDAPIPEKMNIGGRRCDCS